MRAHRIILVSSYRCTLLHVYKDRRHRGIIEITVRRADGVCAYYNIILSLSFRVVATARDCFSVVFVCFFFWFLIPDGYAQYKRDVRVRRTRARRVEKKKKKKSHRVDTYRAPATEIIGIGNVVELSQQCAMRARRLAVTPASFHPRFSWTIFF